MYLDRTGHTYDRQGSLCHTRAPFLIFMQPDDLPIGEYGTTPIRAIVRRVALRQCGTWMRGCTRIGAKWYSVSGAYGHDGLVKDVARDAYNLGVELPQELHDLWNHGGGHNSAGSEAPSIQAWAVRTFPRYFTK